METPRALPIGLTLTALEKKLNDCEAALLVNGQPQKSRLISITQNKVKTSDSPTVPVDANVAIFETPAEDHDGPIELVDGVPPENQPDDRADFIASLQQSTLTILCFADLWINNDLQKNTLQEIFVCRSLGVAPTPPDDPTVPPALVAAPAPILVPPPGPAGPTTVGTPVPWITKSGYAHDKDHPEKGWARTTGIHGTTQAYSDGSSVSQGVESLSAVRAQSNFGTTTARQHRILKNGRHIIKQDGYCHNGRKLPDVLFIDQHPGLSGQPGVHFLYSTQFGKSDNQDEGTGSEIFGITQTSSEVCGCSVPESRLKEWFGIGFATDLRRLRAMVEIYFPKTQRYARVPLTDIGPSEYVPGKIDLTWAVDQYLGTDGGDNVYFRLDPNSVA